MGVAKDSILQPMQRSLLLICGGRGSKPPALTLPRKGGGTQREPGRIRGHSLAPERGGKGAPLPDKTAKASPPDQTRPRGAVAMGGMLTRSERPSHAPRRACKQEILQ